MKKLFSVLLIVLLGAVLPAFAEDINLNDAPGASSALEENEYEAVRGSVNETLKKVFPNAQVKKVEEYTENGKTFLRCTVVYNGLQMSFTLDPITGKTSNFTTNNGSFILSKPVIQPNKATVQLGKMEVNKILKKALPGAAIKSVKYSKKTDVIEGKALYQGLEYNFEIDASRGNVIKMEPAN